MFKNTISQDLQDAIKKVMEVSSPVAEALVGNQHKIDKNKNGRIDAHDFKLLKGQKAAPVKEEQTDEAHTPSHQAATTMKHIPNASPALKKAAKDIKPGIAGYRDRIAMLKAGGVKEEVEELDELKKSTLASYAKSAGISSTINRKIAADFEKNSEKSRSPGMKSANVAMSQKYKEKSWKRRDGAAKAIDRLAKEEVELDEAKSLHKMSANELDQAHKDNEAKIEAIHKNDPTERITKSHPLISRRRSINLHKVIRSKQSNEEVEIDEGSGPKEKQKTPFRNINGPEYKAAADKQRQQMAKDKAAEPGKKMLAKKGVAEGSFYGNDKMAKAAQDSGDSKSIVRMRDAKGTYTATMVRKQGEKDHKEISRVYDKKDVAEGWDDMLKANKERAAAADKAKGTGKFDKKELSPGSTQYTRKSKTFTDGGSDADLRKANRKSNEEVDETTVIHNSYTVNLKEAYTFGEYLQAAKSIVGEDEAVMLANKAFGAQDVGIFEQAITIQNMIEEMNNLEKAGHSISEPKYNIELGNPYYEYTVTEDTGARRKYIHHGDVVTN